LLRFFAAITLLVSLSVSLGAQSASSLRGTVTGATGARAAFRLPLQRNVDFTVTRGFRLPWEHHTLQLRADAFNVFSFVNFTGISLSLSNPGTFGEFSPAQDARVLQFAMRSSF
jgi:hypothetical protein